MMKYVSFLLIYSHVFNEALVLPVVNIMQKANDIMPVVRDIEAIMAVPLFGISILPSSRIMMTLPTLENYAARPLDDKRSRPETRFSQ